MSQRKASGRGGRAQTDAARGGRVQGLPGEHRALAIFAPAIAAEPAVLAQHVVAGISQATGFAPTAFADRARPAGAPAASASAW